MVSPILRRALLAGILSLVVAGSLPACAFRPGSWRRPAQAAAAHAAVASDSGEAGRSTSLGEDDLAAMAEVAALVTRASLDLSLYRSPDTYAAYLAPSLHEQVLTDAGTLAASEESSAQLQVLAVGEPEFQADDERNVPSSCRYVMTVPVRLLATTTDGQQEMAGEQTVMLVLDGGRWRAYRFLGLELS